MISKVLGALTLSGVAASVSGCVAVSMHSIHPVRIDVTNTTSSGPAADIPLTVQYDYDSYGLFYFFNVPESETARTDKNGSAVMNMADFRYRILLTVDGKLTTLSNELVREGGSVAVQPYNVTLKPT